MNAEFRTVLVLSTLFLFGLLAATPASADWPAGGKQVCGTGSEVVTVSDGQGGTIIAWSDGRSGITDIYAQRLDADGYKLWWPSEGVPVCTALRSQNRPIIVSDGAGGAIVVWEDWRTTMPEIYTQSINADGLVQWQPDGVHVCTPAMGGVGTYDAVSDGAGGVIITWEDDLGMGNMLDVFAQRVDATGTAVWLGGTPITVCGMAFDQIMPTIDTDQALGAIITWADARNGIDFNIYAQRLNQNGGAQWAPNGAIIYMAAGTQDAPVVATDGNGGAVIAWTEWATPNAPDIYARRVDPNGNWLWAPTSVTSALSGQQEHLIAYDGQGGVLLVWRDYRAGGNADIYGQRLDGFGVNWWTADGEPICTDPGDEQWPQLTPDGLGGGFFTWEDYRAFGPDVYVQRLDIYGTITWPIDGVMLNASGFPSMMPSICGDGIGGAVVGWMGSVMAQHVDGLGRVGDPVPALVGVDDVPHDQGGSVTVAWNRSWEDDTDQARVTHYSLWRKLSDNAKPAVAEGLPLVTVGDITADFTGRAVRQVILGAAATYWEWMGNLDAHRLPSYSATSATLFDSTSASSAMHNFFVSAHTADPFVYWDSQPDSGYSVDNLAPAAPKPLTGEYQFPPMGLLISWGPNHEVDLAHYAVYKGTSSSFIPGPANLIGSPTDTSLVDASFDGNIDNYYKVSALDIHENESLFSLLSPDQVTGIRPGGTPPMARLRQNAPNPFRASTTIRFSLAQPGRVVMRVYDLSGRSVRLLLDEQHEAREYELAWDGRDDSGRLVPAGIYLYRLETATFASARKLLIMR